MKGEHREGLCIFESSLGVVNIGTLSVNIGATHECLMSPTPRENAFFQGLKMSKFYNCVPFFVQMSHFNNFPTMYYIKWDQWKNKFISDDNVSMWRLSNCYANSMFEGIDTKLVQTVYSNWSMPPVLEYAWYHPIGNLKWFFLKLTMKICDIAGHQNNWSCPPLNYSWPFKFACKI